MQGGRGMRRTSLVVGVIQSLESFGQWTDGYGPNWKFDQVLETSVDHKLELCFGSNYFGRGVSRLKIETFHPPKNLRRNMELIKTKEWFWIFCNFTKPSFGNVRAAVQPPNAVLPVRLQRNSAAALLPAPSLSRRPPKNTSWRFRMK
jgi:hypothetical protein